jgi:hypothetical protein
MFEVSGRPYALAGLPQGKEYSKLNHPQSTGINPVPLVQPAKQRGREV